MEEASADPILLVQLISIVISKSSLSFTLSCSFASLKGRLRSHESHFSYLNNPRAATVDLSISTRVQSQERVLLVCLRTAYSLDQSTSCLLD